MLASQALQALLVTRRFALRPRGTRPGNAPGFTLIELIVVIAVIGIITVTGVPTLVSFLQAQQTKGAARQVATLLNHARQLAISRSTSYQVLVDVANNRLRFLRTTAQPTPCPDGSNCWTGPGTDGNGWVRLENQARFVDPSASPTFSPLGNATAGTITVRNTQGTVTLNVVVNISGRIRSCLPGTTGCP